MRLRRARLWVAVLVIASGVSLGCRASTDGGGSRPPARYLVDSGITSVVYGPAVPFLFFDPISVALLGDDRASLDAEDRSWTSVVVSRAGGGGHEVDPVATIAGVDVRLTQTAGSPTLSWWTGEAAVAVIGPRLSDEELLDLAPSLVSLGDATEIATRLLDERPDLGELIYAGDPARYDVTLSTLGEGLVFVGPPVSHERLAATVRWMIEAGEPGAYVLAEDIYLTSMRVRTDRLEVGPADADADPADGDRWDEALGALLDGSEAVQVWSAEGLGGPGAHALTCEEEPCLDQTAIASADPTRSGPAWTLELALTPDAVDALTLRHGGWVIITIGQQVAMVHQVQPGARPERLVLDAHLRSAEATLLAAALRG